MLFAGSFCEFREFPGLYDSPGITINNREFLRSFRVFPPSPCFLMWAMRPRYSTLSERIICHYLVRGRNWTYNLSDTFFVLLL